LYYLVSPPFFIGSEIEEYELSETRTTTRRRRRRRRKRKGKRGDRSFQVPHAKS
jgi:hypothetical protein